MVKYLALVAGELSEVSGQATSAGGADAGKIVQLDGAGKLDQTLMPVGLGPDTKIVTATEALAAGDMVNIHAGGVRKADASNGREAHGFVLSAVANAASATVYFEGTITGLTGLTVGAPMFLGTGGAATATAPSTATYISQRVGVATSATEISFEPQRKVTLA